MRIAEVIKKAKMLQSKQELYHELIDYLNQIGERGDPEIVEEVSGELLSQVEEIEAAIDHLNNLEIDDGAPRKKPGRKKTERKWPKK